MADPGEVPNENQHRNTPEALLEIVRRMGPIALDPCSNDHSLTRAAIAWKGRGRRDDGLARSWTQAIARAGGGLAFVNPPYGRVIGQWIAKMRAESARGAEIVALVPARTDAGWYQRAHADAICEWRGRLAFFDGETGKPILDGKGRPTSAKFPSALLYYGSRPEVFAEAFEPHGNVRLSRAAAKAIAKRPPRASSRTRAAVLYNRASRSDQDPSLPMRELAAAAAAERLEVLEEVTETGSGARSDRPGLERVLELARRRRFEVLLVWKLDRLARSLLDLLAVVDELNSRGVTVIFAAQGFSARTPPDPASRFFLQTLGAAAEFERGILIERTHLGLEVARRRGVRLGRPEVTIPNEAAAAEDLASGHSLRQVMRTHGLTLWQARKCAKIAAAATGGSPP